MRRLLTVIALACLFAGGLAAQTPVAVAPTPIFQGISSTGAPLASGCLFTYVTGTTTPQATYTDSTGSSQNTNPVILDAAGRAPVWLAGLTYRFKLVSAGGSLCASGVQQYQVDGINSSNFLNLPNTWTAAQTFSAGITTTTTASTGTGTHSGSETFTGSLFTKSQENVQWVDSTLTRGGIDIGDEINKAYTAGPSNGVHIHVAPGIYSYTTPIVAGTSAKPFFLECAPGVSGNSAGNVPSTTQLNFTPVTGTAIQVNTGTGDRINGCSFSGAGSGNATIGVLLGGGSGSFIYGVLDKVDVGGFGVGLQFGNNVYVSEINNTVIHDNGTNLLSPSASTGVGEHITFTGGAITNKGASFSTTCINIQTPGDYHFYSDIDQCGITANAVNVFVDMESHLENPNGTTASPFFTFGAACNFCVLTVKGGEWLEGGTTGVRTEFIKDASTVANHYVEVNILGGVFVPAETVAQLINLDTGAVCCGRASITSFTNGFGSFQFTNPTSGAGTMFGWQGTIEAQDCGTTTSCAQTPLVGPLKLKLVKGSVALASATPSTATITGINPAFTSPSSYVCTASNATTQANPVKVVNVSGSSFTVTGPNTVTDTVNYICTGI